MKTIIFDNDAGNDDAAALMLLGSDPEINIAAITVVGTGLAHGPIGARNMANLCYLLGKPNIPIAYGLDEPCGNGVPFPETWRIATDNMLDKLNVPTHPNPRISQAPVDLIEDTLNKNDKVNIIATGALTNIAQFIQRNKKELIAKIESIVIMGGAINANGNIHMIYPDNTVAEWNIYNDAKAAEIVFNSGINIILVPLDVTKLVPLTEEFYESMSKQTDPSLKLIFGLLESIVTTHGKELFHKEFFLWDALAAEIFRNNNLAIIKKMSVVVDLKTGHTRLVEGNKHLPVINAAMDLTLTGKVILSNFIKQISSCSPVSVSEPQSSSSTTAINYALSHNEKIIKLTDNTAAAITYINKSHRDKFAVCSVLIFKNKNTRKKQRRETIAQHGFKMDYLEKNYNEMLTNVFEPEGITKMSINKIIECIKEIHSQYKTVQPTTVDDAEEKESANIVEFQPQTTTTSTSSHATMRGLRR